MVYSIFFFLFVSSLFSKNKCASGPRTPIAWVYLYGGEHDMRITGSVAAAATVMILNEQTQHTKNGPTDQEICTDLFFVFFFFISFISVFNFDIKIANEIDLIWFARCCARELGSFACFLPRVCVSSRTRDLDICDAWCDRCRTHRTYIWWMR